MVDELFDKIEQQTTRAGDIINQVRMLVTSENTDLQPVSWSSLLDEVLFIMKAEINAHGCRLDCRPAADLPEVLADALQIQLVLINLLQNAVQSMDAVSDNADKVVSIDIKQINARELQVSVADRGPGVAADKIEQIFEPLYSEKNSGMGMGLSVCRSIIEAHDGRIWYTPNPAGGAVFRFTLRLARV
jgi:C4-dicarboxylate-specific signal transduction histidine kinase